MRNITIEDTRIVINFNSNFYNKEALIKSAKAFKDVCEIELNENNAILFTKDEKIALEFCNHVLSAQHTN